MSVIVLTKSDKEYIEAVPLADMLDILGREDVEKIISSFSCVKNKDVTEFLHSKSIEFENSSWSRTFIFWSIDKRTGGENKIVGYISVTEKFVAVDKMQISNSKKKKLKRKTVNGTGEKNIKTFLIGQVARNDTACKADFNMELAMTLADKLAKDLAGMFPYEVMSLECEEKLIELYKKYGFEHINLVHSEDNDLKLMMRKVSVN